MANAISIRLKIDGAAEAKAALEGLGQTGTAATTKLRNSLEALSTGDVAGKFADQLAGAAAKVTAAQRALTSVPAGDTAALAAAQKQVAVATDAYTAALERKRAALVPSAAAEQTLAKGIAETAIAEKLGAITAAEAAAARERAQATFTKTSASLQEVSSSSEAAAKSVKGGQMALRDMALQAQDLVVQISSGQGIFRPLLQQGSQVAQQLQASGQGFGALKSAAGIALGAITTPMGLLVTGAAAATGAIVALGVAAEHESTRLSDLRQQLRATHDDYAALASSADKAAKQVAATTSLSTADARSGAQTIASAKYFSGTSADIERLTKVSADLARVWNTDITSAAGRVRDAINDPAAAAKAFADQGLPAFNQALVTNVTMLERAGQAGKAQKVVLDALGQSSAGAVQDQSKLSAALHDLEQRFTTARDGGKSLATTIGDAFDSAAAAVVRTVDAVVAGMERINSASTVANQNARDLAAARSGAAAATTGIGGSVVTQPGGSVLLGPAIPSSSERAMGIMQLLPSTARGMGLNPAIPDENILGGLTYFRDQQAKSGSVEGALAQYGGYGSNTGAAAGYIGKVQGQDVSKLPQDVASGIEYWGQILGLSDSQIVLGKKIALTESGGRQYGASSASITLSPVEITADSATRRDHQAGTSAANAALTADQRRLSDSLGKDTDGTRALSSLGNSADLARTRSEMELVNRQLKDFAANGDSTSDAFKQAQAQAAGLTEKEGRLLAEERNRLDPQQQFLRGLRDQVAANAGLTEGDQRVLQLRQQMAELDRSSDTQFSPEQRAQALSLLSQTQQQELARQIDGMRQATAGQDNLAAAYGQGYDAVARSTSATAGYTAALKYGATGSDERRAATAALTVEFERQAAAANKLAIAQATRSNDDQLTYLQAETASLGANDDARAAYLAHKQAEILLTSKNISLVSQEGTAYLASVDQISIATAAYKSQEAALNEVSSFFTNTFDTISTAITQAFATGKLEALKFQDIMKSVASAVISEFAKLALLNPLKNLLFGTSGASSPTLSSVGGVLGSLLGNDGVSLGAGVAGLTGAAGLAASFGGSNSAGTTLSGNGSSFNDSLSLGTVVKGVELGEKALGAGGENVGGGLVAGLADKITDAVTNALGNTAQAANIVDAAGTSGNAALVGASVSNALGFSDQTASVIASASSQIADALPYIGAAVSVVTSLVSGDYRGAAITGGLALTGAAIGSIIGSPGVGTAIGAAVGSLISAILPNHPKHPFEDVELNIADGHLATGKSDGQLSDVDSLVNGTKGYVTSINTYLDSVGVRILNADGNLGRIGQGITGLSQTLDPNTLFSKLRFDNDPRDTSNFGVAKGALNGLTFDNPQQLSDELAKIAGFADAASAIGIQLKVVGKDLTLIQVAGVTGGDQYGTSTVTDAAGNQTLYRSDLKTALNADLPAKGAFADVGALDAEIQKVSDFITGTIPSLLTPVLATQSSLQDQVKALNAQYGAAKDQSRAYGLDNDAVLDQANAKAVALVMKSAIDSVYSQRIAVEGRGNALALGYSGEGIQSASINALAAQQREERDALEKTWRETWGDAVVTNGDYIRSMQELIDTQNKEVVAVRAQNDVAQKSAYASLTATSADYAKRAGYGEEESALAAYDAKAQAETAEFVKSWVDYYGQGVVNTQEFQDHLVQVEAAHNKERLALQQEYVTQSTAALKQAQGSVTTLFGSIKDYATKLQTGSLSTLSPSAQYDLAKSQFQAVAGAAAAGDATSASKLTGFIDSFLSASQAYQGSGVGYAADFNQAIDALDNVTSNTDALTNSFLAQQVQQQTDTLAAAQQATTDAVNALRREIQQQTRAAAA